MTEKSQSDKSQSYAALDVTTCFSFLRGASFPEDYVRRAGELGLAALAITDRNGLYGVVRAHQAARDFPNLKLIVGSKLVFSDHPPVTTLAADRRAYGNLSQVLTEAHRDQPKGEGVLSFSQFLDLCSGRPDLIVIGEPNQKTRWGELQELFPGATYVGLSQFLDGMDDERLARASEAKNRFDLPWVAVNDVHFHTRERKALQDVLTAIRIGKPLAACGYELFSNSERYLKPVEEMRQLFAPHPEALRATLEISERCQFSLSELRYRYPSEWIPEDHTAQSYLEEAVWRGARERYGEMVPEKVDKQVRHELQLISKLRFADYFLTIFEIVEFARSRKILCQGRGSAANSAVCYCLGITAIDPVRMEFLFERFISTERGEPPDIDIDFEHERREEVLQHVYERYGRERAAMVSCVVTYRSRSALREVSKAFGIDIGTLSARKIEEQIQSSPLRDPIETFSQEIKGFPRHLSIHSGGFTLSADPMTQIVPIEPARMEGRTIIQWDKNDLDALGLLKVDLLSLGMLSALRKTLDLVGKKLYELPAEDPATYQMIQNRDTVGVFQIESRAQMSMLGRLQPKNFYDLVIEVAIVRPGPIIGKMVHPYLKRRKGLEPVEYPDPAVEKILGKTLGVPLFQEQVMKLAIDLAGFTPGEADQLRRAIGGFRSDGSIPEISLRLRERLLASHLPPSFAHQMYEQIQGFSTYGFPESHSASFALLAYASSYLKCHHPAEFTASLLNSLPMGFYSAHTLVDDAKRHGVTVLPIDPDLSDWDSTLSNGAIRLGWRVVHGLSEREATRICEARPFSDLTNFLQRTQIRTNVLEQLCLGDAFARFGLDPRSALWQVLEHEMNQKKGLQLSLFSSSRPRGGAFKTLSAWESLSEDYRTYGLSTRAHPMELLRQLRKTRGLHSHQIRELASGTRVTLSGLLIIQQRPPTAKKFTFCTLEDEFGFMDLIIPPATYERYRETLIWGCFFEVHGTLERDGNTISIIVSSVARIAGVEAPEGASALEPTRYSI